MKNYIPNNDTIEELIGEKLTDEKKKELDEMRRKERILERYNALYNDECSGLSHGTPITPEHQQAITLECLLDTLRYENYDPEYTTISVADVDMLIDALYQQSRDYLERVRQSWGPKE